jgi:hypothetical protein
MGRMVVYFYGKNCPYHEGKVEVLASESVHNKYT